MKLVPNSGQCLIIAADFIKTLAFRDTPNQSLMRNETIIMTGTGNGIRYTTITYSHQRIIDCP
ncbi:hypothetical protein [Chitinophaga tropicalis]|uniref:Uncharacterized protein n=1 Tax=Chitinophaga tropicalis TaxID=2683588 RepID=A0A7K1U0L1_9BACT|nr:hypothetical protein [Chitinophaga tropicalis]MVT07883.1 hypothetical protein [Chitinophaga tropicalis]